MVALGEDRTLSFRHKDYINVKKNYLLSNGSVLFTKGFT